MSWIGPLGAPPSVRKQLYRVACRGADGLGPAWVWGVVGVAVGTMPLLGGWALGSSVWQGPMAVGLAVLLVCGAARDRPGAALLGVGAGMFAYCALAIGLTTNDPASMAAVLPDGPAYWDKTVHWVRTGESPEYQLAWWVPAHFQLIAATALLSYVSLGATALFEGLYEAGLMNFYVGSLLREANDPVVALFVGWHPWSVARGIGFLFLCYEVVSWSLQRLVDVQLSSQRARIVRWSIGLGFLALDALLKGFFLEPVRQTLANTLQGG